MTRTLVVKVTAGEDAGERCLQGLTVSSVAAASGVQVSLWLTGEAVWLATPGRDLVLPESPPASVLLAAVLDGGTVTVCTQCAARRGLTQADLLEGTRIAGAASFVSEALAEGAQALVY
ncbi:MAG: sulfur reduction protein DsrE [Frankiales bacterium]|nr:sulfur reduction protein DsrE [Frankiales bacterium]